MSGPFCKSCEQHITWATTDNGRPMPLNPGPADKGNVAIRRDGTAVVVSDKTAAVLRDFVPLYLSHFATCPHAKEHRR